MGYLKEIQEIGGKRSGWRGEVGRGRGSHKRSARHLGERELWLRADTLESSQVASACCLLSRPGSEGQKGDQVSGSAVQLQGEVLGDSRSWTQ